MTVETLDPCQVGFGPAPWSGTTPRGTDDGKVAMALVGVHRGRGGRLMVFGTVAVYLRHRIPIFTWLPAYRRKLLRPDLIAGMVLAALAVPQALGYAAIAGVPVQVGLYVKPVDVSQAVLYTAAVAVAAGIVLIIAAQVRIGWIAEFLSKPIVTGFVLGLTVLVIVGELPSLTGIPVSAIDVLGRIEALALGLDEIKPLTAAAGFGSLAILM